jgi:hypothetical protein
MSLELQDIFNRFGDTYRQATTMKLVQHKAMNSIRQCRTAALGGHIDACEDCGTMKTSYNSCRNRNCPKCGNLKKEQWILARKADLLPIPHFHAVFTVPESLHPLFLCNEASIYTLLFQTVAQTLRSLALDKRLLGAEIGFTAVLHTWGQTLTYHPHIHCIVPGGGLSTSGITFVQSRSKFFLPVKAMSALFKKKLLASIKQQIAAGTLRLPGKADVSWKDCETKAWFDKLHRTNWVVYCKKPFRNPDTVVEYLSRYTHKTALYNNRLVAMDDEKVSFNWKDYRDKNKRKIMSLDAGEFVRRFMMHVLPSGLQRIRHYGLLSSRNRATKLRQCFRLLKVHIPVKKKLSVHEMLLLTKGLDLSKCQVCGGHWQRLRSFFPETG